MVKFSAFAIIENSDKAVLLSHRRDCDLWNLPGGGVEPPENPRDAAIREVLEETGLQVRVIQLVGIHYKPAHHEVVYSFLCEITGGELIETDEADEHAWFVDLPPNTSKRQAERIADYRNAPHEFAFTTHDD